MSIDLAWKLLPHYGRALAARMDVTGWVGVALLLCAAGTWIASAIQARDSAMVAEQTVELRRRFEKLAAVQSGYEKRVPNLPDYYASFPDVEQVPVVLKALHEAARKAGFDLAMADYRDAPVAATPLSRYEVSLQISANYPQLRAWLADALNDWPTLALVESTIKRDNALTPGVQAQLRLSLFYRSR